MIRSNFINGRVELPDCLKSSSAGRGFSGLQRSATVLGRSNVGSSDRGKRTGHLSTFSHCCARGRDALRKHGTQWFGRFLRRSLLLHRHFKTSGATMLFLLRPPTSRRVLATLRQTATFALPSIGRAALLRRHGFQEAKRGRPSSTAQQHRFGCFLKRRQSGSFTLPVCSGSRLTNVPASTMPYKVVKAVRRVCGG